MSKTKVGIIENGFVGEAIFVAFSSVADRYVYDTDPSRCQHSFIFSSKYNIESNSIAGPWTIGMKVRQNIDW